MTIAIERPVQSASAPNSEQTAKNQSTNKHTRDMVHIRICLDALGADSSLYPDDELALETYKVFNGLAPDRCEVPPRVGAIAASSVIESDSN